MREGVGDAAPIPALPNQLREFFTAVIALDGCADHHWLVRESMRLRALVPSPQPETPTDLEAIAKMIEGEERDCRQKEYDGKSHHARSIWGACAATCGVLAAKVRGFQLALHVVQDEAPKAALQRYERDVVNHVGGHYGEEQWQTTEMVPCETGAWVKWSDVAALGVKADDGKFQPHDFYRAGLLRGAEIADGMKRGPWGDPHDAITHEHLVEQIVAAIRSAAALGASRPSPADRKEKL